MSGRLLFTNSKWFINIIVSILNIIPSPVIMWMLRAFRGTKGKFGIIIRYILLKRISKNIGDNVSIREGVILLSPSSLQIGSNVSVHPNCYLDASGGITIGNNVSIATASILISETHTWGNPDIPIKYNPIKPTPIIIDDDVWVGCNVKVIGPSHIRKRSILAAGAVVKGVFDSHCIIGGVPARKLKSIRQDELQEFDQASTDKDCTIANS